MAKTNLTEEDIKKIILLYEEDKVSIHKLGELFKVGNDRIRLILTEHSIAINKKGGQVKIGNSHDIEKSNTKLYSINNSNKKLVAICKKTKIEFDDPNNLSGTLTRHILNTYGDIKIPSNTYQRKKYELVNNKKWFEVYFDIVEKDKEINIEHIFKTTIKNKEREELFLDEKNYVVCNLCGKKMKLISNTHLKTKHNISSNDYKLLFPNNKLISESSSVIFRNNIKITNINMKPSWTSKGEIEIKKFIEELGFSVEKSKNRKLLNGKEIDLIIPKIKLGIEYNGLYYHTEKMGKNSTYHLDKTMACEKIGIKLIHIFEDEWVLNKELVKNKLKHILKINDGIKIGGRNVKVKIINGKEKGLFLKENHIQGNDNSTINYGAYYNNELVGVMTFSNKRNMTKTNDGEYELTRYATKQNYIISGLASKFIKQFINDYSPKNIISFADRRWTLDVNNNLYTNIGFKLVGLVKPNYCYYNSKVDKHKRFHKFGFGKNAIRKKYPNMDFNKTEKELTSELGYDRIWDCGLFKYELIM